MQSGVNLLILVGISGEKVTYVNNEVKLFHKVKVKIINLNL